VTAHKAQRVVGGVGTDAPQSLCTWDRRRDRSGYFSESYTERPRHNPSERYRLAYDVGRIDWAENANGRLLCWLPRQIDIDKVSDEEIQDTAITANLTQRKCLGFRTPFQAILKELGKDVQIRFA
jgi:hypothetical protein